MKELTTGENRKQFEEWYYLNHLEMIDLRSFYNFNFKMQLGVLLSFYDSLGLFIEVKMFESPNDWIYQIYARDIMSPLFKLDECNIILIPETRNQAFEEAFEKANKLINDKLK